MNMIHNLTFHSNRSENSNGTAHNKDIDPQEHRAHRLIVNTEQSIRPITLMTRNHGVVYFFNERWKALFALIGLQVLKWISLIILLGILSLNILVLALLLSRKNKSRMKFFVANLAFADLCVGIFFELPETLFNRFEVQWNPYVCYIYYVYFSMVPCYVSTYAIVVLSIDRAYVIVKPLAAASKGNTYRYGLALSAWITGCLLAIPYGVFGVYTEDNKRCEQTFPNQLVILYADLSSIIIIPVIVITVCYIIIIITIRRREMNGFMQRKNNNSHRDCCTDASDTRISKAKIRSIQLLFVVVFAYVICWAPVTIAAILLYHEIAEKGLWFQVLFLLAPLNSLSNPLVFLIFNKKMLLSKTKKTKTKVVSGKTL